MLTIARNCPPPAARTFTHEPLRDILARAVIEQDECPDGLKEARRQLKAALKDAKRSLTVARVREAARPEDKSLVRLRHRARAEVLYLQALQLLYQDLLD